MHHRLAFALAALLAASFGSCKSSTGSSGPNPTNSLVLLSTHALAVSEPSGLTIDDTGTILWTCGNKNVVKLGLDGTVLETLSYDGQDLESVEYDPSDQTLWVAEERRREVVHLDLQGNVLSTIAVDISGDENSGLEGFCLDVAGDKFALNEKKPALFLELRSQLAITPIDFAADVSGIAHDPRKGCFWILSDQDQTLYSWRKADGVLAEYRLGVDKPEGVAYDPQSNLLYIVSDSQNTLYVYQAP